MPHNNLNGCTSERKFGEKSVLFLMKTFFSFLVFTWIWGQKCSVFFFWSSLNFHTWTKSWSRFIPPMLIIGRNWGKIANYPPNAQQRSAPLTVRREFPHPNNPFLLFSSMIFLHCSTDCRLVDSWSLIDNSFTFARSSSTFWSFNALEFPFVVAGLGNAFSSIRVVVKFKIYTV